MDEVKELEQDYRGYDRIGFRTRGVVNGMLPVRRYF
jgi:hypothetical protein